MADYAQAPPLPLHSHLLTEEVESERMFAATDSDHQPATDSETNCLHWESGVWRYEIEGNCAGSSQTRLVVGIVPRMQVSPVCGSGSVRYLWLSWIHGFHFLPANVIITFRVDMKASKLHVIISSR